MICPNKSEVGGCTAKTLVLNMQHQAGVKLAVLIFGVGLTPLGVNTKSKTARFGTFL